MRVLPRTAVARLTLAIAASAAALFGVSGVWLVERESQELIADERQELILFARALQVSVENALRDRDLADIAETLATLEVEDPLADVSVWDQSGRVRGSSAGAVVTDNEDGVVAAEARRTGLLAQAQRDDAGAPRLTVGLPLRVGGSPDGAVVVSRRLANVVDELTALRRSVALMVGGSVAVAAALGLFIGGIIVGRPLRRLNGAIARVRGGDLTVGPGQSGDDDLAELEGAFREMTLALAEARRALDGEAERRESLRSALERADKLASVGQLSAMLAHEIASPLQVLVGRAEALAEDSGQTEKVRREAGQIGHHGRRIAQILDRLLGYARRSPTQGPGLDPGEAVQQVVDLLRPGFERKGVQLSYERRPLPHRVGLSPEGLQQATFNLLANALAAVGPGARVVATLKPVTSADPAEGAPGRLAMLAVEDDGPGVPEALRDQVFEPFFTTRGDLGGTGLGLAVVRGIALEARGSVSVAVGPLGGARFEVLFPLEPEWPASSSSTTSPISRGGSPSASAPSATTWPPRPTPSEPSSASPPRTTSSS